MHGHHFPRTHVSGNMVHCSYVLLRWACIFTEKKTYVLYKVVARGARNTSMVAALGGCPLRTTIFSPLYTNQDIWSWRLITLRTYTSWECKYELTRVEAVLIIRGGLMVDAGEREWETDRDGAFSHVRTPDDTGGRGTGFRTARHGDHVGKPSGPESVFAGRCTKLNTGDEERVRAYGRRSVLSGWVIVPSRCKKKKGEKNEKKREEKESCKKRHVASHRMTSHPSPDAGATRDAGHGAAACNMPLPAARTVPYLGALPASRQVLGVTGQRHGRPCA